MRQHKYEIREKSLVYILYLYKILYVREIRFDKNTLAKNFHSHGLNTFNLIRSSFPKLFHF